MTPDGNRGGRETNWSMTVREYLCHFPLPALASCSLSYSPLSFPNLSSIVCRSFFSLAVSGGRAAAISVRFISRSMRGVDRRFAAEATAGGEIPQPHPSPPSLPSSMDEGSLIGPLVINEVPYRRGRSRSFSRRRRSHRSSGSILRDLLCVHLTATSITDNPTEPCIQRSYFYATLDTSGKSYTGI